jgi:fused signal recognition particle receptor
MNLPSEISPIVLWAAGGLGAFLFLLSAAILLVRRRRAPRGAVPVTQAGLAIGWRGRLAAVLGRGELDDAFWSSLETTLIEADAGLDVTERLLAAAKDERTPDGVRRTLAEAMVKMLSAGVARPEEGVPRVLLVLGVNGVGKTTTIAKLARGLTRAGKRVLLIAGDTFRAAATEQLSEWGRRLGCEVVSQAPGADAAAVAFDGCARAKARGDDAVIIDTAGRLHTKQNLMEELKKIARVIGRAVPGAPHEKLLVIDATVGSNGLAQAREFHAAVGLTGIVVTKLDGTAKGGVVLAVANELGIPITHIGVGEGMDDLRPFDAQAFVDAILGS